MIKAAILGADNKTAGELIRLLIDHPDVQLTAPVAPSLSGTPLSAIHHGLLGRKLPPFTDRFNPEKTDVVFIASPSTLGESLLMADLPKLKVVAIRSGIPPFHNIPGVEYGLSEINRKPLVRGALKASIPSPGAALTLVALFPLATHLLINQPLNVNLTLPEEMHNDFPIADIAEEISSQLKKAQESFPGKVSLDFSSSQDARGMRVATELHCPLSIEEVLKIYDTHFDDHNFTYFVTYPVDIKEVIGTNRCIISLSKPDKNTLCVTAIADARLRGGAGEAVHVMNLLFGLQECVGLQLKAARY